MKNFGLVALGIVIGVGALGVAYVLLAPGKDKTPPWSPSAATPPRTDGASKKSAEPSAKDDAKGVVPASAKGAADAVPATHTPDGPKKKPDGTPDTPATPTKSIRTWNGREATPVLIKRPNIKPGDHHLLDDCVIGHRPFVMDHVERPDFYLPRKPALGRELVARFPGVVGLHLHFIAEDGKTLATFWPGEKEPSAVSAKITPDVRTVLVVVPPSTQFYFYNHDGSPGGAVAIPPEVIAFRVGDAPIESLPAVRAVGVAELQGFYQVAPLGQNWFSLAFYGIRAPTLTELKLTNFVVPAVFSAGMSHEDGTVSWWFVDPWPDNLTVEQTAAELMELRLGIHGEKDKLSYRIPAPPKVDVAMRPPRPVSETHFDLYGIGNPGEKYHVGLWVWPEVLEPGDEEGQGLESKIVHYETTFAPKDQEHRTFLETFKVDRKGSPTVAGQSPFTVRYVLELPK